MSDTEFQNHEHLDREASKLRDALDAGKLQAVVNAVYWTKDALRIVHDAPQAQVEWAEGLVRQGEAFIDLAGPR